MRPGFASLLKTAAAAPRRPFLLLPGGKEVSYGRMLERAGRLAAFLAGRGVLAGDRVVVKAADPEAFIASLLALLGMGAAIVPLDPETKPGRAAAVIGAAKAKLLITGDELPEKPAAFGADAGESLTAYILFTSGTTAAPKGVEISHGALLTHLETCRKRLGYDARSRILNPLSMSHADGIIQGPLAALYNGCAVSRAGSYTVAELPALMDGVYRDRITHMIAVPAALNLMLRMGPGYEDTFRTEDFRLAASFAGMLEEPLWRGFKERFGVALHNVYGLTETVSGGLFAGPDDAGTVGVPVDCSIRVVAPDGADAERGELWLSGPHLMTGYFDKPEETAAVLREGWLRTGDLAERDAAGRVRIVGRAKNVIVSGGFNVQPEEVEEALNAHPSVRRAAVLGVADPLRGEAVTACVETEPGGVLSPADLAEHCRRRLEGHKVPARFHFIDSLPVGPSGKVRLEEVRALVAAASGPERAGGGATTAERVRRVAAACFMSAPERLTLEDAAGDTDGWDSLGHLALANGLEKEFGVDLTPAEIMGLRTLGQAAELMDRKARG